MLPSPVKTLTPEKIFGVSVFSTISIFLLSFGFILIGTGGTEDLAVFHRWLSNAFNNTIAKAYEINNGDYPPLLVFTFFPVALLRDHIGFWAVIHLSILFNLLLSTFVFYKITR